MFRYVDVLIIRSVGGLHLNPVLTMATAIVGATIVYDGSHGDQPVNRLCARCRILQGKFIRFALQP